MTEHAREWHRRNKMPRNATFEERVAWYLGHLKHCDYRRIPAGFAAQMRERGIDFPEEMAET
jgi:hypothetical protein